MLRINAIGRTDLEADPGLAQNAARGAGRAIAVPADEFRLRDEGQRHAPATKRDRNRARALSRGA